jgi:hypothetical protein
MKNKGLLNMSVCHPEQPLLMLRSFYSFPTVLGG